MVKTRPARDKSQRFDPLKAQESEFLKDDLITSLRSSENRTRELACIAVANMPNLQNPSEILKLIIERITDTIPAVQISALHAAITQSKLYSQDLINLGVIQLVTPIISSNIGFDQLYSNKQEELVVNSLVSNSLYLLSSLASENERILEGISNSDIITDCVRAVLTKNKTLALSGLDLLNLCIEDNKKLSKKLVTTYSSQLLQLLTSLDSETKISVTGLMTSALIETNQYDQIFQYCLPILLEMISIDIYAEFNTNVLNKLNDESFKFQENFWTSEAKAQQLSLEVLTNLLAVDGEEEPKVIRFITENLCKSIAKAAAGLGKDAVLRLFNFSELMISMIDLQCAAFSCIQNLIVNTECLSQNVGELWATLVEHLQNSFEFQDEETEFQENFVNLSEILSKNMCALCQKYPDSIPNKTIYIPGILQIINTHDSQVAVNLLGALSILGKAALSSEIVENLVNSLIKCCSSDNLEINTEALNVFFDVFCDEKYDLVLVRFGVLNLMQNGALAFKSKISDCQDYEIKEHSLEAYENLIEFIKYKAGHIFN